LWIKNASNNIVNSLREEVREGGSEKMFIGSGAENKYTKPGVFTA
jgi:hypothetical protein